MIFDKTIPRPQFLRQKNYVKNAYFETFANSRQKCVIGLNQLVFHTLLFIPTTVHLSYLELEIMTK